MQQQDDLLVRIPTGAAAGTGSANAGLMRANRPSGSDADSRCTRSPWVAPGSDTVRPVGKVSMSVLSCAVTRSSSVPRCCTTSGTARPDDMIRIHSIRSELTNAEPRSRSCSRNPRTHGSTRANQNTSGSHQRRCRLTSMPRFRLAKSAIRVTSQGHCGLRSSAAASRACTYAERTSIPPRLCPTSTTSSNGPRLCTRWWISAATVAASEVAERRVESEAWWSSRNQSASSGP